MKPMFWMYIPSLYLYLIGTFILSACGSSTATPQGSAGRFPHPTRPEAVTSPQIPGRLTPPPTLVYPDLIDQHYQGIQLAWFYKPPADGDLINLAEHYTFFILTRKDEEERDALRSLGVQKPILQYLRLSEIEDPGSCTQQPHHNQVAEKIGDFCLIQEQHPDWFLRDGLGNMIKGNTNNQYRFMDPLNSDWRSFWLERARISQKELGWQGVFLDNVEASLGKRSRVGQLPKNYPDDASFQAAIEDNLRYLYTSYFKPLGRPLFANIIDLNHPAVWFRYIQYLDGAMIESFAVGWHEDYKKVEDWETEMDLVERTQILGKEVILVSQGEQQNKERATFALASYLLVNHGKAYFRYNDSAAAGSGNWLYDLYSLDLGLPSGPRYRSGTNWVRDFENAQVSVDPASNTARIDLKP